MSEKEYIERGAFLRKCAEAWGHYGVTIKAIEGIADECAAADVVEVRHGNWIIKTDEFGNEYMMCSYCEDEFYPAYEDTVDSTPNYCPTCGARMDGERKNQI